MPRPASRGRNATSPVKSFVARSLIAISKTTAQWRREVQDALSWNLTACNRRLLKRSEAGI
jgi:hypothetical protein